MKTNFDLGFSSALVMRTPAYSYLDYTKGVMPLHELYFRTAILMASPVLYNQLVKKQFDPDKFTDKERLTLLKYFNRMCFRPTPFGLFSGLSYIHWGRNEHPPILSPKRRFHAWFSYTQTKHFIETNTGGCHMLYTTNHSVYQVGEEYRYLTKQLEKSGKFSFTVRSIVKSDYIAAVLAYCQSPRSMESICKEMKDEFDIEEDDCIPFIHDLAAEQILLDNQEEPIIAEGNRWIEMNEPEQVHKVLLHFRDLADLSENSALEKIQETVNIPGVKEDEKNPLYIISEYEVGNTTLNTHFQSSILDGINCLRTLSPTMQLPALAQFRDAFSKKFDQQFVPLLQALDPELGIDYLNSGKSVQESPLLAGVHFPAQKDSRNKPSWTSVHAMMLRYYTKSETSAERVIRLTESDLLHLTSEKEHLPLPPSFSVLFKTLGEQVYLEEVGGATATSLIGRFTKVNDSIAALARNIAEKEETANPDILFAEIVHVSELHSANIERREPIRKLEIPTLTASCKEAEDQVLLSELWIGVVGKEVLLWSSKHQKRVIPRLSSAYNYHRSEFPIYRFLADLQHQGIQSGLSFKLRSIMPGLDYYPRVTYKQSILSLAEWHPGKELLQKLKNASNNIDRKATLLHYCNDQLIPRYVAAGKNDNVLVLDLESGADLEILAGLLLQDDPVVIREFPFTESETSIKDLDGKPYISQYVAALHQDKAVYQPFASHPVLQHASKRSFIPGSDWLYLKLYCHPTRSNELLVQFVAPYIRSQSAFSDCYFFIRYSDPDYHIRIRMHYPDLLSETTFKQVETHFSQIQETGLISKIIFDTYERELERYGAAMIEEVEFFFCGSSELILAFLAAIQVDESQMSYYQIAFSSLHQLTYDFGLSTEQQEYFFQKLYLAFSTEFKIKDDPTVSQQLSAKFRELRKQGMFDTNTWTRLHHLPDLLGAFQLFQNSVIIIAEKVKNENKSYKVNLLGSLVHMHLNRIFTDLPRRQEMVIYYCMSKHYYSQLGREQSHRSNPISPPANLPYQ